MPGILTNAGRTWHLRLRVGQAEPEELLLKLFVNDATPSRVSDSSDFLEPVGRGYHSVRMNAADWAVQPAEDDQPAVAVYPEVIFTFLGPIGTIFGYFLVTRHTGICVGAERFDKPRPVEHLGDQEKITVTLVQR